MWTYREIENVLIKMFLPKSYQSQVKIETGKIRKTLY